LVLAALGLLLPALAWADAPAEAAADPQQQLLKLKITDPQHYARLRHNLAVFLGLSPERQEAVRKLQRDLQDETTAHRQRLERVMDRYADWIERLPEADRQSVLSAPDRKSRLARIHEIRDQQWLKRLPKAQADKIAKAKEAERPELIKKMRQEELADRLDWLAVQRFWDLFVRNPAALPIRIEALSDEARETFEKTLRPLLSKEEEKLLKDAEGKWPRFPRTLADLAEQHPVSVQGPIGPTSVKEWKLLPPAEGMLQNDKKFEPLRNRLKDAEGKWPDFGLVLKDVGKGPVGKKMFPPLQAKYMPASVPTFPAVVQQFIEKKLLPALEEDEAQLLKKAEGHWPNYPNTVLDLSRKHNLAVPLGAGRLDGIERYRWRALTNPPPGAGRRGEMFGFGP
jgi:hypothetical protein